MKPYSFAVLMHALCLLTLTACTTNTHRQIDATEREALAAAADGQFDSALRVAERYKASNDPRALHWYARAAAIPPYTHRSAAAEQRLGTILERGRLDSSDAPQKPEAVVLKPSPRKALRWFRSAAYHGSPYAMRDMERWHANRGDMAGALRWRLRHAVYMRELYRLEPLRAAANEPVAVGRIRMDGTSLSSVVSSIQRKAARGDAEAQVDLGALHEAGIGVPQDQTLALHWYQQAAEQGNVYGQYLSGLALGRGSTDLQKDVEAAATWFARAHAQQFYMAEESYWREAIKPPFFIFE